MNFKNFTKKFTPAFFVLIIFSLFTFFQAPNAFACDCASPSIEGALSISDAVFTGKASKVKYLDDPQQKSPEPRIVVTFDVSQWWKGSNEKQAILYTVYNSWSCNGFWFKEGEEYLVYASEQKDGTLGTSFCRRTNILAQATEDLALLGKGIHPVDGSQTPGQAITPTPTPASTTPSLSVPTSTPNNFSSEILIVVIVLVVIGVVYKIFVSRKGVKKN